jgi:hypothetical protein
MTQATEPLPDPQPTEQDRRNAATREAIAAVQLAEYDRVLLWALEKFGKGWLPSGRHYLLDKAVEDETRRTGERPAAAATCYTVRNAEGHKRHFTVKDGLVTECSGYEEAFGPLLLEPHPTLRIEVKGQKVAPHRYNLCWAPIETYQPRSAEQLAAARVTRERKKAARLEKKYAEDYPLFAEIERQEKEGRGR